MQFIVSDNDIPGRLEQTEMLIGKLKENKFDLNDLLMQMEEMKKMGSIKDLLGMIPGVGKKLKDAVNK